NLRRGSARPGDLRALAAAAQRERAGAHPGGAHELGPRAPRQGALLVEPERRRPRDRSLRADPAPAALAAPVFRAHARDSNFPAASPTRDARRTSRPSRGVACPGGKVMVSRRKFIGVSAIAVAGTACHAPQAHTNPEPTAEGAGDGAMPPAIAALTSAKAQAQPITVDERRARIERA